MNRFSVNLRRVASVGLFAAVLLIGASRATSTPSPNQLVWEFDGQNGLEQQGVSVAATSDSTPLLLTGLQTDPSSSLTGNHVSARVYSGVDGTQVLTIAASLQFSSSVNTLAVIRSSIAGSVSEFVVGTPRGATPGGLVGNGLTTGIVRLFDSSGTLLKTWEGAAPNALFGAAVAPAGDVNNDGAPDVLIGSPGADRVYIYSSSSTGSYPLLVTINGPIPGEGFGTSVAHVRQFTDPASGATEQVIAIGAPLYPGAAATNGRIYIYSVSSAPLGATLLYSVTGDGSHDMLGMSVDGGVDVNGDGTPDFLGGAIGSSIFGPTGTGYVRLYSGIDGSTIRTITSAQVGDLFGYAAQFGGPCLNTASTVIAGAPQAVNPSNQFVTGRVAIYNASTGVLLTQIYGEHPAEAMGTSVSNAPDLTGDGEAEFMVGAPGRPIPTNQYGAGAAFAYSCRTVPRPHIVVVPHPLDFGAHNVGSATQMALTLSNAGSATLNVVSISLLATSNPSFHYAGPTFANLAPGNSQIITLTYTPVSAAIHGGTLRVLSNDPLNPTLNIHLSGQGLQASLVVTPTVIPFGSVDVSDTAWAKVSLMNTGNVSVTVSGITFFTSTSTDLSLGAVPALPLTLQPLQSSSFQVLLKPTSIGPRSGTVRVSSNDPVNPAIDIHVSGAGAQQNIPPTAVINMLVPYSFGQNVMAISFIGHNSFDPDDAITSYAWNFGDGSTSTVHDPQHSFAFLSACPCYYIVRLTVTDSRGKSDSTSVTVPVPKVVPIIPLAASTNAVSDDPQGFIRSRFWGTLKENGANVPADTVVEAWVKVSGVLTRVAESLVQTHLGQSVYAIEVPPYNSSGPQLGGTDGVSVTFRYNGVDAGQTGTWWNATDQRIDLTINKFLLVPDSIPCMISVINVIVCGSPDTVPHLRLYVALQQVPIPPLPNPGPLKIIETFSLNFTDANTGAPVTSIGGYDLHVSYTDAMLAAAGVHDEHSLRLYYLSGNQWLPAGSDRLDIASKQLNTHLNHASIFALVSGSTVYLPVVQR